MQRECLFERLRSARAGCVGRSGVETAAWGEYQEDRDGCSDGQNRRGSQPDQSQEQFQAFARSARRAFADSSCRHSDNYRRRLDSALYQVLSEIFDSDPNGASHDPRLEEAAGIMAGLAEQARACGEIDLGDEAHDDRLADLLDSLAAEYDPRAERLLELMRQRGLASWTPDLAPSP